MCPIMPPHSYMKDDQLADILYVRNAWGNRGELVQTDRSLNIRQPMKECFLGQKKITILD